MNEENLIEAPIDEKNVSSDWIEEVFDCVWRGGRQANTYTGFIGHCLVSCKYSGNKLHWQVESQFFNVGEDILGAYNELRRRLTVRDQEDQNLVVKNYYYDKEFVIAQHFFFKED